MKDFAKSIYVGNAKDKNGKELRIGDIVLVWTSAGERAGKVKAVSGERITVEIRNEGDWSTPGKLADKVSNKKTGNKKSGNSKVGNADILSGNYIILADNGEVWFRDEHENVHIRNIDSWAQKKIAEYQRSIDEIKKGVQEAKQQAKKFGLI